MKRKLISGVAILTFSSFIIKVFGFITRIFMSHVLGAEGTGLYQLVLSFYALGASVAVSGISVAVSALTGARPAVSGRVVSSALKITLVSGFAASFLCFFLSEQIGRLMGDLRIIPSVRVISLSFPFTSVFACLTGYFNGRGEVRFPVMGQIIEQTARIMVVFLFLKKGTAGGIVSGCFTASLGIAFGEAVSGIFLLLVYRKKRSFGRGGGYGKKLLSISLPSAAGGYFNSLIHTVESSLIPQFFMSFGLSRSLAMGSLGIIKGMASPIAFFPNIIISSVSTVVLPAFSRVAERGGKERIKSASDMLFRICFLSGGLFAAFFCIYGDLICGILFKNAEAGRVLSHLGPVLPFLYINNVSASILYGVGKQKISLVNGISEGILRLVLMAFLIPLYGTFGYILALLISEALAALFNILSVNFYCGGGKGCIKYFICMVISFGVSVVFSGALNRSFRLPGLISSYILVMIVLKTIKISDFKGIKRIFL